MRQVFGVILLFMILPVQAQKFGTSTGSFQLEQYGENILKLTYHPAGEQDGKLYSDAVIGKPGKLSADWQVTRDSATDQVIIGHKSLADSITIRFFQESASGFRLGLGEKEEIFGGGERAIPMNRRGHRLPLYNAPQYGYAEGAEALNYSVPLFLGSRGYALFADNPSRGYADIGQTGHNILELGFTGGELNLFILLGRNMDEQLQAYSGLTGRQPLPPRWVFGNFMSRFGYISQEQVLQTLDKMQSEKFPVDAVVLDLFWFGDSIKGTLGNLDWMNKKAWPNPKGMIDTLRSKNIRTILVTEPFILEGTKHYDSAKNFLAVDSTGHPYTLTDFYFGRGGLVDLFRTDARNWFWSKYDAQIRLGIAGWWGDLGEPEKHPVDMFHHGKDLGSKKPVRSDLVHNLYGHYWSKMLSEKYTAHYPQQRLFYLNRAGFAGSQRFGVFPWSGDVSRSWSGLRAQLPLLQGMSISGVPYIHSDAGGFAGGDHDAELYVRWLQFATFTPVFRPHGTNLGEVDRAAVSIPSEPVFWSDTVKDITRRFVQLRYDLLPYNYTLAYDQSINGKPLIRPMNYYSFSDSNLNRAADQYMWGESLLVAPVLEKAAATRKLYLPPGDWYNFFTNQRRKGGEWVEEKLYPDKIPVYAKASSFIPTRPGLSNTEDYKTRLLVVKHYSGRDPGDYMMYDDDGQDPKALLNENYERIFFHSEQEQNDLAITVKSGDRRYKGRVVKKFILLEVIGLRTEPSTVKVDELIAPFRNRLEALQEFKGNVSFWDPVNQRVFVLFEYTGREQRITINY